MSLQQDLDNLNAALRSISSSNKVAATALINGGAAYLRKLKSDKVPPIKFDPTPAPLDAARQLGFFSTAQMPKYDLPNDPALQKVTVHTNIKDGSNLPKFTPPNMTYEKVKTDYHFAEKLPKLTPLPDLSDSPEVDEKEVEITEPTWYDIENIIVGVKKLNIDFELPDMPVIDHAGLIAKQMEEFNRPGGPFDSYRKWVANTADINLFDDLVLDYIQNLMGGDGAPGGQVTAVTDNWEIQRFRQALNEAMEQYRAEMRVVPIISRAGVTGMPDGDDVSRRVLIEIAALRKAAKAIEDAEASRRTIEVKHQKWALALAVKMVGVGLELRYKSVADAIRAMKLGVEAAADAEALTDALYAFKRKQFELVKKYNDLIVNYIKQVADIEKQKLEKVKLEAEQNEIISQHNDNVAKQYEIATRWIELRLAIYDAQLEHINIQYEAQKIYLDNLSLSYKKNEVNSRSVKLDIKVLEGNIAADSAKLSIQESEFAKFEAGIDKLKADISADISMVESQYGLNKAKLEKWITKNKAIVEYQQLLMSQTQAVAQGLLAKYDAEFEEMSINIDEQDFKNRKELESERRKMQKEYSELRKLIYHFSMLVNQRLAQSKVSIEGASTVGNIAEGAFGGMTAIGGGSKTEFA